MPKNNPQLEEGYTKISNNLLEALMLLPITKEEFKLLLAILRETYGWNRKEASISYSRFQILTGVDRRHIGRALNFLLEKSLITRQEGEKMKFGKPVYNYQIIKNHWCQGGNRTIARAATEAIARAATNKEIKENINKGRINLVDNFNMNRQNFQK